MKTTIVLAMHGAPPNDFPRSELSEFFGLHNRMEHAPDSQRSGLEARYAELDQKMRAWPRTEHNDPFYAGACALANVLSRASGCEVIMGFNEFCGPSLDQALDYAAATDAEAAATAGQDRVIVLTPMMTRGGEHSEIDIPRAIEAAAKRHPQVTYHYAWPLDLEAVGEFLAEQARRFMD